MASLLDRETLLIMISAFALAVLCILPDTCRHFPFWIIAAGLHVADTLFHEMGHTIFAWLFGHPAIPMIFTLFGADQAGGMSMRWDRNWFVQIGAFAMLGYACFWLKENGPRLFIPMLAFSVAIVLVALFGNHEMVISYMGHGGSIAMGGFFLYRAWIYLDARNAYERWLNALFGFFLTLYNFYFSYTLAFRGEARAAYEDHVMFGITHNDFSVIAMMVPGWTVPDVAKFTMFYAIAVIILAGVAAVFYSDAFDEPDARVAD